MKLYKAYFDVFFVSDDGDKASLSAKAFKYAREEMGEHNSTYNFFDIVEVKSVEEIPNSWKGGIPYGDGRLTEGKGTTTVEVFEQQLLLKLAGIE